MNDLNNIKSFVSLLHGVVIFNFISKQPNTHLAHQNLINQGNAIIKENLTEFDILNKYIENILKTYENFLQSFQHYSWSNSISSLEVIFQNVFKGFSNSNHQFPYSYSPQNTHYYLININQPTEFPLYIQNDKKLDNTKLQKLWNEFFKEFLCLKEIKDITTLNTTLYYLLYKYTVRLPSCIQNLEDVSLFDYIRVLSAIYICQQKTEFDNDKKYVLIKGDLTGIQNYIYSDIFLDKPGSTEGLSKKLRGRSFFISLLTDFIANLFIQTFDLEETNIIYSGGGHFLVLLPNSNDLNTQIIDLEKKINLEISELVELKLSFILGKTELDEKILENASEAIQKVNQNLNQVKQQKFISYIDEIFELNLRKKLDDEKLGQLIPHGKYLLQIQWKEYDKKIHKEESLGVGFKNFNTTFHIVKSFQELENLLEKYISNISKVRIYCVNEINFIEPFKNLIRRYPFSIELGFKVIATYVPRKKHIDNEEPMIFEEISQCDREYNKKLSFDQLGILRLDVDNLGTLFAFGLEKDGKTSLMRTASLSRELHHYFAGFSNQLCKEHQIYTVYSGGDDAFFIGSWINILYFAKEFKNKFNELVCNNPNFTFSAGLFMCDHKHPIGKFAEQAAELEELSKNYSENNKASKNAITVFDHTLRWEKFNEMLNFAETLLKYVDDKSSGNEKNTEKLARSFVHRILRMIKASLYSKNANEGKIDLEKLHQNAVQIKYLLARRGFTAKEIEKNQKEIVQDVIKVLLNNFNKHELIKNYIIPLSYVILKTRKKAEK